MQEQDVQENEAAVGAGVSDRDQLADTVVALGLDTGVVKSFSVEFKAGDDLAVLTWTSVRRIPVGQALAAFGLGEGVGEGDGGVPS